VRERCRDLATRILARVGRGRPLTEIGRVDGSAAGGTSQVHDAATPLQNARARAIAAGH
jgi:hypothetical protein